MREIETRCPTCGSQNLLITSTTCTDERVVVAVECLACDGTAQVVVQQLKRRVSVRLPEPAEPQAPMPVVLEHSEAQQQRDLLQEGLAANAVPSVSDVLELEETAGPIAMIVAPGPLCAAGAAAPIRWRDAWGLIADWEFFRRGSGHRVACEHCDEAIEEGEQCAWIGRLVAGDRRGHSMHWACFQHLRAELNALHGPEV